MNIRRKITLNTLYQLISRYSLSIFAFLVSIIIIRSFGREVWGEYSIVLNYIALFYIFADFGTNVYFAKSFAEDQQNAYKYFSKIVGYKLVLGSLLTVMSGLILVFLPYSNEVKSAALWGLPIILAFSLINSTNLIFQSRLTYKNQLLINGVWAFSSFILTLIYVLNVEVPTISGLVQMYLVSAILALGVSISLVREYFKWNEMWDPQYFKVILGSSYIIGIAMLFNSLMFGVDKFLLSVLSTGVSVGIYSLSYKLFEVFLVFPTFLMNAFYPVLVNIRKDSDARFGEYLRKLFAYNLVLWFISVPILMLVVYWAIPALWGNEMSPSWLPFAILMVSSLPFFATAPLNWVAVLENRSKLMLKVYFIGLVINLALNFYLIQQYDYIGAAVSTGITEFVVLVGFYFGLRDIIKQ